MTMKISDEIRRWCKAGYDIDELRALADRIDSEMVELPKDADGKPIHVGDTVYGCRSGMKMTISELRMTANGWSISTSRGYLTDAEVTHAQPDSWERIAKDLEDWSDDNRTNWSSDVFDRAAEFAHRIRKLAEK
ncbi:MAG: hypothetical protein SO057_07280 [Atopobiaceae bacterium]|nr:hypothetical protein [Atopobiaceae bacterium]